MVTNFNIVPLPKKVNGLRVCSLAVLLMVIVFAPSVVLAQETLTIVPLLKKINGLILNPLIILMIGVALAYFIWGLIEFLSSSSTDDKKADGKRNMMWGVIGLFIMFAVYGVIQLILDTFGIDKPPLIP